MSQPNPKFNEYDYTPSRERRGSAPITNFPGNALGGDIDPTRELRALIEQLQQNARDARTQLQTAVAERDELGAQLDQLRAQNQDLRTRFVEITAIIRERDTALAEVERLSRSANEAQTRLATVQRELTDAQRQREELVRTRDDSQRQRDELIRARDDAHRQRDEAVRQREELRRQIDTLTRTAQEANQRFSDTQRQLTSIRQARDAAQSQKHELTQKLSAMEERVHELKDQLDAAERAVAEARSQVPDPTQLSELHSELDATQQQLLESAAELQQLRAKIIDLTEQKAAALENGNAHATALVEAQEQLAQVTYQRDQAHAELVAKDRLIEEIRMNPDEASTAELEEARRELASYKAEREATEVRNQLLTREVMEMRQQLQARAEQIAAAQRTLDDTSAQMSRTRAQFDQLAQERGAAVGARDEAMTSLAAAQKQIERIIRERDLIRQQSTENAIAMEAQIEALLAQLSAYEASDPTGSTRTVEIRHLADRLAISEEERRELAERLDRQRSETIDLGAQLQAAHDQIRELSASLAEARLQALSAGSRSSQKRNGTVATNVNALSQVSLPAEVFDAGSTVSAMRQAYQAFVKSPSELHLLDEITSQAQAYAEQARVSGLVATHRLSVTFASLAQELFHYPEQINQNTLRTVQQGIEFLATLPKVSNLAQAKDPATTLVYAVDDDPDNCECIHFAMETAMVRTASVQDPAKALCELGSTPCDLIFLDVSMPGINGFELCTSIRNLALHVNTPVIFLTGLATTENRMHSNLSGGNDFVGKPFLVSELTLKALMLMMKAQLHLA